MIPRIHNYCENCNAQRGISKNLEGTAGTCPQCNSEMKRVYDKLTNGQWFTLLLAAGLVLQGAINSMLGTFSYAPSLWVAWYNLIGSILGLVFVLIGIVIGVRLFLTSIKTINWNLASEEIPSDYQNHFLKAVLITGIVGAILAFLFAGIVSGIAYAIASVVPPL